MQGHWFVDDETKTWKKQEVEEQPVAAAPAGFHSLPRADLALGTFVGHDVDAYDADTFDNYDDDDNEEYITETEGLQF